jgi:DNA adenine methylase
MIWSDTDQASSLIQVERPVLRWHGGKWLLADWILSHFPRHRIYTEVFGGAGSVLMRKPGCYAEVYNDLNQDVVNLFRVLRDSNQAKELEHSLRLTPFAREEFRLSYEPAEEPIERARRLVIRCYMGFGSAAFNSKHATGFRANSSRSGTTPAHDWANYPDAMAAMVERLRGVIVENRPALEVIKRHDGPETLHYVDPPYVHVTRKNRQSGNYGDFEMTDGDHRELAGVLRSISGMVVLSGYPCALYDELYGDWDCVRREAMADGARKRIECLWLSPATKARLHPTLF